MKSFVMVKMYCRILRNLFALTHEIGIVGMHCIAFTVFTMHHGFFLSLEKKKIVWKKSVQTQLSVSTHNKDRLTPLMHHDAIGSDPGSLRSRSGFLL